MAEHQAGELAQTLMGNVRLLTPPSREDRETLARILDDVSRDVPVHMALWIAFWLGCAWQNSRD